MKDKNYVVSRDNIYVGKVIKTRCIYNSCNLEKEELEVGSYSYYRNMMFIPTEKNFSEDLFYNSPNYPILNMTDEEYCLGLTNSTIIKKAYNLNELLKALNYKEELTYEDLIKIRNEIFNFQFLKDNCSLFGYKIVRPENWTYIKNGEKITDPKQIKKCIAKEKKKQKQGDVTFHSIKDSSLPQLPHEYWDLLYNLSCQSTAEIKKAFTPSKNEGKIKKLTKY